MMASLRFLVLLVCTLVPLAHAATNLECPVLDCESKVKGYWVLNDDQETEYVVKEYHFYQGSFSYYYENLNDPSISDPDSDCRKACENYNLEAKDKGYVPAGYWMFEETCDGDTGGTCYCLKKEVCDASLFSDEWAQPRVSGVNYRDAANYTAGKVCDGGEKGDPHFTGADGSHFDFSGEPNKTYALISDAHVQVNAYFGGRWGEWEGATKSLTWVRDVAILWGHHSLVLSARTGPSSDYGSGYLSSITSDGQAVFVAPGGTTEVFDGAATVAWTGVKLRSGGDFVDEYLIKVKDVLVLQLTLRPEVPILRTPEDGLVHFAVSIVSAKLSSSAHGIVGQTFRPDFAGRLEKQTLVYSELLGVDMVPGDNADGFIDGTPVDYQVAGPLKTDCRFCRFARATEADEETARAVAMSAGEPVASMSSSFSVVPESDLPKMPRKSLATWR